MAAERPGHQDAEALAADFPRVAVGAVQHAAAPPLADTGMSGSSSGGLGGGAHRAVGRVVAGGQRGDAVPAGTGQRQHRALYPHLHGGRCRRVGRRRARPGRGRLARVRRQRVGWQRLRWWEGRRDGHGTSVCGGMEHDECAAPAGVGPDLPAARDQSTGSGCPSPGAICSRERSPRPVRAARHVAAGTRGEPSTTECAVGKVARAA